LAIQSIVHRQGKARQGKARHCEGFELLRQGTVLCGAENRKRFRNDSKRGRPPAKLNTGPLCRSDLQAAKPPKWKSIASKREKTSDSIDLSEKRVNLFCRESEKLQLHGKPLTGSA